MTYHTAVLLYSNYSQSSQKLLSTLQSCPVNFAEITGINSICIDNEKIRKQIYLCKHINISIVPVLLLIYPNSSVEKYDHKNQDAHTHQSFYRNA